MLLSYAPHGNCQGEQKGEAILHRSWTSGIFEEETIAG
jgi:hypothetical protein